MEYSEFKRQVQKAGLTIGQFSSLIGVPANSTSNFKKKGIVPATYAALGLLCAEAKERGIDFLGILARYGMHSEPSKQVTNIEDYRTRAGHVTGPKKK